jgi:hypothetical protein
MKADTMRSYKTKCFIIKHISVNDQPLFPILQVQSTASIYLPNCMKQTPTYEASDLTTHSHILFL